MRLAALLLAAACLTACSGSCCTGSAPDTPAPSPDAVRPGYSGSVPSPEAQDRITAVLGKEIPVGTVGVTEAGWKVVDFGVVPSDAAPGGKGPVVRIRKGSAFRDVFVPDDAAVDALVRAVDPSAAPR
jgi:hypothetical protein